MGSSGSAKKLHIISSSPSGISLWRDFQEGSHDAFAKIYRLYVTDLYHYGMHICGDPERVKDCLQDLFQDLWSEREHLSPEIQNIKYYLISSFRRKVLRSIQKDKRHHADELVNAFDFEITLSHEDDIIGNETREEQMVRLHEAMESISKRQREAVYLRFYQNLSNADIARIMSVKVESVYNIISKAIGLLQKMLSLFFLFLMAGH